MVNFVSEVIRDKVILEWFFVFSVVVRFVLFLFGLFFSVGFRLGVDEF